MLHSDFSGCPTETLVCPIASPVTSVSSTPTRDTPQSLSFVNLTPFLIEMKFT